MKRVLNWWRRFWKCEGVRSRRIARTRCEVEVLESRTLLSADWAESNNTLATAYDMGPVQGDWYWSGLSLHVSGDEDWFKFRIDRTADSSNFVRIEFPEASDLGLTLHDAAGNMITYSNYAPTNFEQVSLNGLPAGTYYARVYSYYGYLANNYTFRIAAPTDRYEPNNTVGTATNLGTIQGAGAANTLSLHTPGDVDWFKFTLASTGTSSHYVRTDFTHAWGDIDMALYDASGTALLNSSTGSGNREEISLAGLQAGTYALKVYGYNNAPNLTYNLSWFAPSNTGDRFEPNNTLATATNLGTITGVRVESSLSLHASGDNDYFRFTTSGTGTANNYVRIDFAHLLGDIDLELLDTSGNRLGLSTSVNNSEQISLANLPANTYVVRVYGYQNATNSSYFLTLNTPLGGGSGDALEPNNTAATATNLGRLAGNSVTVRSGLSIHTASDVDWFRFELPATGVVGNSVRIDLLNSFGDLDMQLYAADAVTLLGSSLTTSNREEISLTGRPAGVYFVRVYGYSGATNPMYTLTILAPPEATTLSPDRFESPTDNNASSRPTALGTVSGTRVERDLTIPAGDVDWFRFTTSGAATSSDSVSITYPRSLGELTLDLYDQNGVRINRNATDGSDRRTISLSGLAAGTYMVRVAGATGTTANRYNLELTAPAVNDWTVLLYMTASNLEVWSALKINALEQLVSDRIGRAGSVQFVVLWDQTGVQRPAPGTNNQMANPMMFATDNGRQTAWGGAGYAIIQPDSNPESFMFAENNQFYIRNTQRIVTRFEGIGGGEPSQTEVNTGDPNVLRDFILWGVQNAPAQRYALILQDHGGGWLGSNNDFDGIGNQRPWDESLTLPETAQALREANVHFDVIAYDACLMGMAEVAYTVQPWADWLVASEEVSLTTSWNYYGHQAAFLPQAPGVFDIFVNSNPSQVTGQQLAQSILAGFRTDTGQANGDFGLGTTASVINLANISTLTARLHDFTAATATATANDWRLIEQARIGSDQFGTTSGYENRDLYHFLERLTNSTGLTASIRNAAQAAFNTISQVILGTTDPNRQVRQARGLSVYMPAANRVAQDYLQAAGTLPGGRTGWNAVTGWVDFLLHSTRPANLALGPTMGVGASGQVFNNTSDWSEPADSWSNTFDLGHQVQTNNIYSGLQLDDYVVNGSADQDWFRFTTEATGGVSNRVVINYDPTVAHLRLALYSADNSTTPLVTSATGSGQEVVSLNGRAAGQYRIAVSFDGTPATLPYELVINAPVVAAPAADWAAGNGTSDRAADLGTMSRETVASGLVVEQGAEDWFRFATPVTVGTQTGVIHLRPAGAGTQPWTAELRDQSGNVVALQSGTGELHLEYSSGSNSYLLGVRNDSSGVLAYTIRFEPLSRVQATLPVTDAFERSNTPLLGYTWTEREGDYQVANGRATAAARESLATLNGTSVTDVRLEATLAATSANQTSGLVARYLDANNFYWGGLVNQGGTVTAQIRRRVNGTWTTLLSAPAGTSSGTVRFDLLGSSLSLSVNGQVWVQVTDDVLPGAGAVGLRGSGGTVDAFSAAVLTATAGVTITESGGSTNVAEGGATDTYTIVLNSQPTANVTVTVNPGAQLSVTPTTLTFTPTNWNTPQTVTVSAVNDSVVEGNHSGTITHTLTSADAAYNGIAVGPVTANITDNDSAGVTVVQSGGSTVVAEGGATDTYTVVLSTQPTATVTITLNAGTQLSVTPSILTFTTANWNTAQTVTVSAVNDSVAEGNHSGTITHTVTSTDANYMGINVASVTASITDNDSAGVVITQSGGSTVVAEGGATDTYTIVLTSQPTANVAITLNAGTQLTVTPTVLTFTPANWNTVQTVMVSAVDDTAIEGNHNGTITHSASSSDANYNGISIGSVTAAITDNDSTGVTVETSGGSITLSESTGVGVYSLRLNSQPMANVTIGINFGTQLSSNVSTITFTPVNWNIQQSVGFFATDDSVAEGNHTGTITHTATSADPNYNGIAVASITVNIIDNDTAGVTVTESNGSTAVVEGGATDTYSVVLTSQPTAHVTVTLNPGNQLTVTPTTLTFTSANWNVPQTITVSAVDDSAIEGNHTGTITHSASSSDANYNGIPVASVVVNITDNDSAVGDLSFSSATYTVGEAAGSLTITVQRTGGSNGTVSVQYATSNGTATAGSDYTATSGTLTFGPGVLTQTFTLAILNDLVQEGNETVNLTLLNPTGGATLVAPATAVVTITDDDVAGFNVLPTLGLVTTEAGGTANFTVRLNTQPTSNVIFTLTSSNTNEGTVSPSVLTFTPTNWNVQQIVTVTGVDDQIDDGDVNYNIILNAAISADPAYNGLKPSNVSVTNVDNEVAGFTVTPTTGLITTEAGGTATFTVRLNTIPTGNVLITVVSSNPNEGTVSPTSLLFTPTNALTPQTVTVTGVDDQIDDGDVSYTIQLSPAVSADPNYNNLDPADVSVVNHNNDLAGFTITPTSGLVTTESGGTATFSIRLNSVPTANVTISLSSTNPNEGVATPPTLVFTPANALTPQTVTVIGVDDSILDGDVPYTIVTGAAVSVDPRYNGLNPADVTVVNRDNDVPPPSPPPLAVPAPVVQTRPVGGSVVSRRMGRNVRRVVRIVYADTGEVKREIVSPFQQPAFTAIAAQVQDTDGDGIADTVLFTARRGGKRISRLVRI